MMQNLPADFDLGDYPELPPDECWDIPNMPLKTCIPSWNAFHNRRDVSGDTKEDHEVDEIYVWLALQIPDHKKGTPLPPS